MNYDLDEQAGEVVAVDSAVGSAGTPQSQATEMAAVEQSGAGPHADAEAENDENWEKTGLDRAFATADPQ